MRIALLAVVALATLVTARPAAAEAVTRVAINGVPTPVHFSDGDSFRVMSGPMSGVKARLSGYNTLESFGPVHSWGRWTAKELHAIAKLATLTARRGVWNCEGDGKLDTYGRTLLFCRDLARDLISKGLAHAYSVDEQPADMELLAVQRKAIQAKLGMWAHGAPRFILTSLHAKSEGGGEDGETSNRLISTTDGRTQKWAHDDDYAECQKVCHVVPMLTTDDIDRLLAHLRKDPDGQAALAMMSEDTARLVVTSTFEAVTRGEQVGATSEGTFGIALPQSVTEAEILALYSAMNRLAADRKLVVSGKEVDSCQVYVDYRRRFGGDRALCLR